MPGGERQRRERRGQAAADKTVRAGQRPGDWRLWARLSGGGNAAEKPGNGDVGGRAGEDRRRRTLGAEQGIVDPILRNCHFRLIADAIAARRHKNAERVALEAAPVVRIQRIVEPHEEHELVAGVHRSRGVNIRGDAGRVAIIGTGREEIHRIREHQHRWSTDLGENQFRRKMRWAGGVLEGQVVLVVGVAVRIRFTVDAVFHDFDAAKIGGWTIENQRVGAGNAVLAGGADGYPIQHHGLRHLGGHVNPIEAEIYQPSRCAVRNEAGNMLPLNEGVGGNGVRPVARHRAAREMGAKNDARREQLEFEFGEKLQVAVVLDVERMAARIGVSCFYRHPFFIARIAAGFEQDAVFLGRMAAGVVAGKPRFEAKLRRGKYGRSRHDFHAELRRAGVGLHVRREGQRNARAGDGDVRRWAGLESEARRRVAQNHLVGVEIRQVLHLKKVAVFERPVGIADDRVVFHQQTSVAVNGRRAVKIAGVLAGQVRNVVGAFDEPTDFHALRILGWRQDVSEAKFQGVVVVPVGNRADWVAADGQQSARWRAVPEETAAQSWVVENDARRQRGHLHERQRPSVDVEIHAPTAGVGLGAGVKNLGFFGNPKRVAGEIGGRFLAAAFENLHVAN